MADPHYHGAPLWIQSGDPFSSRTGSYQLQGDQSVGQLPGRTSVSKANVAAESAWSKTSNKGKTRDSKTISLVLGESALSLAYREGAPTRIRHSTDAGGSIPWCTEMAECEDAGRFP